MRNREGFTLIEMLAVVTIVAMLCAALGVGAWKMYEQISIKAVRAEMQSVLSAMEEYYQDYGSYPAVDAVSDGGTVNLVIALQDDYDCAMTTVEHGGYAYWCDAWRQYMIYQLENSKPLFKSKGVDQLVDTNDDIIER